MTEAVPSAPRQASTVSWIAALILGSVCLFDALLVVDQGDVAMVYRFGAVQRVEGPGLRIHIPWPIESAEIIRQSEVRLIELDSRRMLTADTNLVDLKLAAQYTVSNPMKYALDLQEPDGMVAAQVMAVATRVVATMEVDRDNLLTAGRSKLQQAVLSQAQVALNELGAGVRLAAVEVQSLVPPPAVVDAFNDVSSARGDRDTLALAAEGYASKLIPDVRGATAQRVEGARAEASRLMARVSGDIDRFGALATAEADSSRANRTHLYIDLIQRIGPRLEVHVVAPGTELFLESGDDLGPTGDAKTP